MESNIKQKRNRKALHNQNASQLNESRGEMLDPAQEKNGNMDPFE